MKAAVCREFGKPLVIEEVNLADEGPGEVRVKIAAVAICHSDITYADGGWGGTLPAIFGHECAGVVERVGQGVTTVKAGDTVVVTLIRSCGHCHGCSRGMPVTCSTQFPLDAKSPITDAKGNSIVQSMRTGGFAEYVVVHESQCVSVPTSIPAPMSEIDPGTMAAYSQNILGSKMGSARIQVDIPNLVDLYSQGRVKLDELVTKTYKLEDINEAIDAVKRGDALRNVIVF
ncbi:MAG: hypothetical protein EBZ45_05530 [Actinobacteria bacterium]|nr:hypothetical protein [Actinomycetota bacterium]